jgi:putative Holliday junction resolvase
MGIIAAENMTDVAKQVVRAARNEGASQFVLGMPYNSSGGEGEQAIITRAFGTILAQEAAPMPVYLWDERFSSAEASMRMNQGFGASVGESVDAVAAAIILEEFFDGDHASAEQILVAPGKERETVSRAPPAPVGPPPSYLEARRLMMERAALQEAALAATGASLKSKKKKKKR